MKRKIKIFVSYSHQNEDWVSDEGKYKLIPWLNKQLNDQAEIWTDHALKRLLGEEYTKVISEKIVDADFAVLLISQDFVSSSYIMDVELPLIRQQYEKKHIKILPLLVTNLTQRGKDKIKWIFDLQTYPNDTKPLLSYVKDDDLWENIKVEILEGIEIKIHELENEWKVLADNEVFNRQKVDQDDSNSNEKADNPNDLPARHLTQVSPDSILVEDVQNDNNTSNVKASITEPTEPVSIKINPGSDKSSPKANNTSKPVTAKAIKDVNLVHEHSFQRNSEFPLQNNKGESSISNSKHIFTALIVTVLLVIPVVAFLYFSTNNIIISSGKNSKQEASSNIKTVNSGAASNSHQTKPVRELKKQSVVHAKFVKNNEASQTETANQSVDNKSIESLDLNGNKYKGGVKNGKPNGIGTVFYTKEVRISENDDKNTISEEGDYLKGKWSNGVLEYGTLFSKTGEKKTTIVIGRF